MLYIGKDLNNNMKKMNLPVAKNMFYTVKCLSMNDYLKFVNLNLKYTIDMMMSTFGCYGTFYKKSLDITQYIE